MSEKKNALDELAAAFAKNKRKQIDVEGLTVPLFSVPMTLEDNMRLLSIHEETDPGKKSRAMCQFLVTKVELEDGTRAFRNCRNKPASEVLQKMVDPATVLEIFSQVASSGEDAGVEELVGKSGGQESE